MYRKPSFGGETARIVGLVLICFFLFSFGSGTAPLWDGDEGLHATTSKVMVTSGDWLVPTFNGRPFYDKPPLFSWLVALSFRLFGFSSFAARLPAAVVGLLSVLAVYRFGSRMLGRTPGFLGAVVLATSLEFVVLSRTIVHDIALELCVTLALFAFYRAWAEPRHRTAFLLTAYVATGLALLAKGPIGVALPGAVMFFFLLARRDLAAIRSMMVVRGALLVLLVGAPWYLAVARRDPDYLRYFLIEKNFGSFASEASTHPNPFWYYLPILVLGFLPWGCFLPFALGRLLRRVRELDPARLFLLVWFGFVLLFFSAATSKLPTYILPLFPPGALLIGDLWADYLAGRGGRRGMVFSQLVLILILAWAVPVFVLQATEHKMYDPEAHLPHLVAIAGFLIASVLLGSVFLWRRQDRALFVLDAALIGVIVVYLTVFLLPVVAPYRTTRDVALALDARLPAGEPIVFYPDLRETALFYTDRRGVELKTPAELEAYLDTPGAICVLDPSRFDSVAYLADRYRVIDREANKLVVEAQGSPRYMRE